MPSQSPRAATSGPRTQRKRPGDLTGVTGQGLAAERDARQADEEAAKLAAKSAERVEKIETVVDYTDPANTKHDHLPEVHEVPEEVHPLEMTIRVNYPIEDMTFGKEVLDDAVFNDDGVCIKPAVLGNLLRYDFEEGVQYRVPWELGLHLKRLGYVYDF